MARASTHSGAWAAPRLVALMTFPSAGITQFRCLAVGPAALSAPNGAPAFLCSGLYARPWPANGDHTRWDPQTRGRLAGTPGRRGYTPGVGESLRTTTITPRWRARLGAGITDRSPPPRTAIARAASST